MNKIILSFIIVIVLVGGLGASYYFIPSVKNAFDSLIKKDANTPVTEATLPLDAAPVQPVANTGVGGNVSGSESTSAGTQTVSTAEFEALVARLGDIKRKIESKQILTDQRYLSLQEFSVQIIPEEKGNTAPFKPKPISVSAQRVNR
jgi:hypothetical protein